MARKSLTPSQDTISLLSGLLSRSKRDMTTLERITRENNLPIDTMANIVNTVANNTLDIVRSTVKHKHVVPGIVPLDVDAPDEEWERQHEGSIESWPVNGRA